MDEQGDADPGQTRRAGSLFDDAPASEPVTSQPTEAPKRVCPSCSTQSQVVGDYCPHCGASYLTKRPGRKRRRWARRILAIVILLVVVAGGGAAYAIKHNHDQKVQAQHRAEVAAAKRRRARAEEEAQAAAAAAARRRAEIRIKKALRRSLIKSLEASVTKDAEKDVADGLLTGPILRTECTPVGGGNSDPLAAHTGNWSCTAVTKDDLAAGTSEGYAFSATVNYDDASYTWHLGR
jgi:hypothetical protein